MMAKITPAHSKPMPMGGHVALSNSGFRVIGPVAASASVRSSDERAGLCWHGGTNAVWQPKRELQALRELVDDVHGQRRSRRCHGVIDARVVVVHDGFWADYTLTGTLVRAEDLPDGSAGFLTHLDATGVGQLIGSGWVPVTLIAGVMLGSHHDAAATRRRRLSLGNRELAEWTSLLAETRSAARDSVTAQIKAAGADGALHAAADLTSWLVKCPRGRDRVVRATFLATAIARFAETGNQAQPPLTTLNVARSDPRLPTG